MKGLLSTHRVFIAVVFLGLAGLSARNVIDPDVWWHLKTGEYIASHKQVPRTDPFSYTRAGTPWVAHEWLTDLMLYGIYRCMGWAGLILVFAVIIAAAFLVLFRRCAGSPYVAGILTIFGAWATVPVWGVRPQVLSLLLTSLWLLVLESSERNPRLLFWTLPIMLFWVNLHAGFALGVALLLLFLVGGFLELVLHRGDASAPNSPLHTLAVVLVLNLLLVPLNPQGARMYSYPLETLRSNAMQNYIAEWASPNFHRLDYFPLMILLLVAVGLLAWGNTRLRATEMLLLLVTAFAALSAIRMIPAFVLVVIPILSRAVKKVPALRSQASPRTHHSAIQALNAGVLIFITAFVVIHIAHVIRRQPQSEAEHFPRAAVDFLEAHATAGPIFNHYDWGGYLIWRLYPPTKVFIDGRADLYGEALLQQFAETYQLKRDWKSALAGRGVATIIVPPDSALATGVRCDPGWRIAYEDYQAVVFSKLQP